MNDALLQEWNECASRALEWTPGDDPMPVFEALALSVALELTGDLAHVRPADRDGLRAIGQRALLFAGAANDDEEDVEAIRLASTVARDGLRALSGRPVPEEEPPGIDSRVLIMPRDLTRLLGGRLDGLTAGWLALRVRRSESALRELRAIARLAAPEGRRIALAAADAGAVLDPAGGRPVGTLAALGAEAVLFEGTPRRLAIYAESPDPLRLVAPELTTEDVREGYWLGRVAEGARRIDAMLHAGGKLERWILELP
jgi:hypothetical protein